MKKLFFGIVASVVILIGYCIYFLFFDWSRHKQELLVDTTSPDGRYTVELYVANSHATTPFMLLGVLIDNKSSKESKIYWAKGSRATVQWEDTNTVTINKHTLTIPFESYDFRND